MSGKIVSKILIVVAWLLTVLVTTSPAVADQPAVQKAVLVTGANSGIGRNIADRLAAEGYFVYAGARKANDLRENTSHP